MDENMCVGAHACLYIRAPTVHYMYIVNIILPDRQ